MFERKVASADARRGLNNLDVQPATPQVHGGSTPGEASPDHHHVELIVGGRLGALGIQQCLLHPHAGMMHQSGASASVERVSCDEGHQPLREPGRRPDPLGAKPRPGILNRRHLAR